MIGKNKYTAVKILENLALWIFFGIILYSVSVLPNQMPDYFRQAKIFVILAGTFYLNYYVLIPKFLFRKKFRLYALSILGTLFIVGLGNYYSGRLVGKRPGFLGSPPPAVFSDKGTLRDHLEDKMVKPDYPGDHRIHSRNNLQPGEGVTRPGPSEHGGPGSFFFMNLGVLLLSSISITVSTSIRGTSEWFKNEKQLKEIENEKLSAELSYLKAQINPHFFFNTLNGIYALARQKSDKTPDLIMKLSIIMRYIIYEANAPQVPLIKELKHIANYIELQRIRLTEMVKVDYEVHGSPKDIMIEPLLFSVFVENAFKHGIDYSKRNTIRVSLDIYEHELYLMVSNPVVKKKGTTNEDQRNSGVGLNNIRQRLQLLYPNRHLLKIKEVNDSYQVNLKLILTK